MPKFFWRRKRKKSTKMVKINTKMKNIEFRKKCIMKKKKCLVIIIRNCFYLENLFCGWARWDGWAIIRYFLLWLENHLFSRNWGKFIYFVLGFGRFTWRTISAVIQSYEKFSYSTLHQQSSWSVRSFFILCFFSSHPRV